ncbi:RING-6 protein [Dendryphion nanum]|uniref:RING-6 protein n=1 Tax=Dendryphion nanum TaxID=256645 RepID=A0A9P9D0M2_9PLEO|nr:RING-6 protein [Dendryphion nanum]
MTKKRKRWPDLNQKLERPWCYYCERDFDDLKILISHQKAKHFKCERCGRRLNTAGGLSVHMNQVHKENLTQVENAVPGRSSLDIEIFGMEGVPQDVIDAHTQHVTHQHFEEEQERARVTGNPVRGQYTNGSGPANKRPKVKEDIGEIVKRAAKYRVDKANGTLPPPVEVKPAPSPPVAAPNRPPPSQTSPFPAGGQQFPPPGAPQYPPGNAFPGNAPSGFQQQFGGQPPQFPPGGIPPRPGSIPTQGLPPRPPFGGPPGAFIPGQNGNATDPTATSVDEMIAAATASVAEAAPEKKSKKDKNFKLIYSDDFISPEEKMALLPRYASAVRG